MAACAKTVMTDTSAFAGPVLTANSARLTSPCVMERPTTPDWPKSDGPCPCVSTVDAVSTATDSITTANVPWVTRSNSHGEIKDITSNYVIVLID